MRQFVADASHELRTPLTTIRGFAELYRQGAAREPAETEQLPPALQPCGAVPPLKKVASKGNVFSPDFGPVVGLECRIDGTGAGTSGVLCRCRCDGRIWNDGMACRRCVSDGSHACQRTAQQGSSITRRGAGTGLAAIYYEPAPADVPLVAALGLLVPVAPITMNGKGVVSLVAAGTHTCAPRAPPPSGLAEGMANRRHYPDHFGIGRGDQPVD